MKGFLLTMWWVGGHDWTEKKYKIIHICCVWIELKKIKN